MNGTQHIALFNLLHDIHNSDLNATQVRLLALLYHSPGMLSNLAASLGFSTPVVTEAADVLEARGLAQRTRGIVSDRRVITLSITEAGIRCLEPFSRYLKPLLAPVA